jgi:hypothetical protein
VLAPCLYGFVLYWAISWYKPTPKKLFQMLWNVSGPFQNTSSLLLALAICHNASAAILLQPMKKSLLSSETWMLPLAKASTLLVLTEGWLPLTAQENFNILGDAGRTMCGKL